MFVRKNPHAPQLSEVNCHARFSHSKYLLKNIHPVTLTSFLFTDEEIFTVATLINPQND